MMIEATLALVAASVPQLSIASVASEAAPVIATTREERKSVSRWFARAGVARARYNTDARITTRGNVIPGSTAGVTDSTTLILEVGYDLSDDIAVIVMGGIPPSADVVGGGSVSSFGKLGHVRFGPAVVTVIHRLPAWRGIRPYVGAGGAHLFILKAKDGSVSNLKVRDHNGFVLQAGIEYRLSRKWELFADYKHVFLNVHATGFLAGEPVRAKVTLNPDLMTAGIKFHFD